MTSIIATFDRARTGANHGHLPARLTGALGSLFERWTDDLATISGDSDSSLLGIGRDLQTEASLLHQWRGR
jgi:hypothetical protein